MIFSREQVTLPPQRISGEVAEDKRIVLRLKLRALRMPIRGIPIRPSPLADCDVLRARWNGLCSLACIQ